MTLRDIKSLGKCQEVSTGKVVDMKQGRNTRRNTNHIYYLSRGKRIVVPDYDFYSNKWKIIE